jgi:hypothetical protein
MYNYNQHRVFDRMMTDVFTAIVNNPTAIVPLRSQQRLIPNNGRSRLIATSLLPKVNLLLRENSNTFVNIEQAQYETIDIIIIIIIRFCFYTAILDSCCALYPVTFPYTHSCCPRDSMVDKSIFEKISTGAYYS